LTALLVLLVGHLLEDELRALRMEPDGRMDHE
jgi:hypothetical protein